MRKVQGKKNAFPKSFYNSYKGAVADIKGGKRSKCPPGVTKSANSRQK